MLGEEVPDDRSDVGAVQQNRDLIGDRFFHGADLLRKALAKFFKECRHCPLTTLAAPLNQFEQRSRHPESDDDQRRGQSEQRTIAPGTARRYRRVAAWAEDHAADMQQRAREDARTEENEENAGKKMPAIEGRAHNQELALKEAEGRHADDRQHGHEKDHAGQRHGPDHAAFDLGEQVGPEVLIDVARAEKQQRLGDGVKGHVQHQAQAAQRAAESQRRRHDAGMIDGGVRQQAAIVLLHQHERNGDAHGEQAEEKQQVAGILRAQAPAGQDVETDQAVERAVQHAPWKESRRWAPAPRCRHPASRCAWARGRPWFRSP